MTGSGFSTERPVVGLLCSFDESTLRRLADSYELSSLSNSDRPPGDQRAAVRALVTRGDIGADRSVIASLPNLEIIACYGVGFDAIDLDAARARGIRVTNTPDVLTEDVADMGIGLALAVTRQLLRGHAHVRSGRWPDAAFPLVKRFYGSRVGVVGYGRVGKAVARRAAAFDCEIGYFDIASDEKSPHSRFDSLHELAGWADMLIVTVAGGPTTARMIDASVLEALGPNGYLVNISRGSAVDELALLTALECSRIAGAGLDVYWNEPNIDPRFRALDNVVLQPHHASATVETRQAMGRLMCDNLDAHFNGGALLTPVA